MMTDERLDKLKKKYGQHTNPFIDCRAHLKGGDGRPCACGADDFNDLIAALKESRGEAEILENALRTLLEAHIGKRHNKPKTVADLTVMVLDVAESMSRVVTEAKLRAEVKRNGTRISAFGCVFMKISQIAGITIDDLPLCQDKLLQIYRLAQAALKGEKDE